MTEAHSYPLFFATNVVIPGRDFLARVHLTGRLVAVLEDNEEWWFYGVMPGALAEGAATPPDAFSRFTTAVRNVLEDIAHDADTFEAFDAGVRRFVFQIDNEEGARWMRSLQAFRASGHPPDAPFDQLERKPADTKADVEITRLDPARSFEAVDAMPSTSSEPPLLVAA